MDRLVRLVVFFIACISVGGGGGGGGSVNSMLYRSVSKCLESREKTIIQYT